MDYVEEFLLQVMNDEFETHLEDGSAEIVAAKIVGLRKLVWRGDFREVDEMLVRWQERERKGAGVQAVDKGEREGEDTDWDSDESEEVEEGEDTGIGEAEQVVKVKEKPPPPEVDEDGFTKVIGRRKR